MNWSKGDVTTMVVEFTLHPPPLVSTLPLLIQVVTGAFLIVLVFTTGRRAKSVRQSYLIMLIIGVVMIGLGVGLSYSIGTPSSNTVGNGYLFIKSPSFGGAANKNITSRQIQSAYVGSIGMGKLTISKQHGTNIGDFDVGVFTLAREATAYVVSDN